MTVLEYLNEWVELTKYGVVRFKWDMFNKWWHWRMKQSDLAEEVKNNTPCNVAEAIRFYNDQLSNENNSHESK